MNKSHRQQLKIVLSKRGFLQHKEDWIREDDEFRDCITLQTISQFGTTLNIYCTNMAVIDEIKRVSPGAVGILYPVSVRIGDLMPGAHSFYWRRDRPSSISIEDAVEVYVLPFLLSLRNPIVLQRRIEVGLYKWRNPSTRFFQAMTHYRAGEIAQACVLMNELPKRLQHEQMLDAVRKMRGHFGCDPAVPLAAPRDRDAPPPPEAYPFARGVGG